MCSLLQTKGQKLIFIFLFIYLFYFFFFLFIYFFFFFVNDEDRFFSSNRILAWVVRESCVCNLYSYGFLYSQLRRS